MVRLFSSLRAVAAIKQPRTTLTIRNRNTIAADIKSNGMYQNPEIRQISDTATQHHDTADIIELFCRRNG